MSRRSPSGRGRVRGRLEDIEPADLRRLYLAACAALASYYLAHKLAVKRQAKELDDLDGYADTA